jgi:glycosyltransferase involved in cell wall biosynthesis
MSKDRILYLCGTAPWLRNGGQMLRNYWLIDALAKKYAVDLVVADEPGPMPEAFAGLVAHYACFPRSASLRRNRGRLLRAATSAESMLTAGWTSPALREHVSNRLGQFPYAAIQVDLPMVGALPRRDGIPIVYNAHNCESTLLRRRAKFESPHIAVALAIDAVRVERQERSLIARSALVAACAESDLDDFARFAPNVRAKSAIVPNGVDVRRYASVRETAPEPGVVLITGSMDWRPNVLGLRWFLQRGLAQLQSRMPEAIVRIAGRMDPSLIAELQRYPNVEAIPNPVSMEPHLAAATVVAAPIVASSGTRLRILEAWAAGRPVVTTTAGAFGLDGVSEEDLLVRDDPAAFAEALVSVLSSPALRAKLAGGAQQRVRAYDWPRVGVGLLRAYERIVPDVPRRISVISGEAAALSGSF